MGRWRARGLRGLLEVVFCYSTARPAERPAPLLQPIAKPPERIGGRAYRIRTPLGKAVPRSCVRSCEKGFARISMWDRAWLSIFVIEPSIRT